MRQGGIIRPREAKEALSLSTLMLYLDKTGILVENKQIYILLLSV